MAGVNALPGAIVRATFGLIISFSCLSAHATLVAIAPSRDGLVIAADSRLTFHGAQCDGAFKILIPARPLRTVAVVTGASSFVAPPPAGRRDLCRYLATAPRLLDLGAVVKEALGKTGGDASRILMEDLSSVCVVAAERFRERHPDALNGYEGKEIFSVVVASFDAERVVSTVRRFVVRLDATTQRFEAIHAAELNFELETTRDVWVFGETDWVKRVVYSGAGRRFLKASTLEFLENHGPVGEVSVKRAADAATNILEAASKAAKIDPPPSGIGGEIRAMVIGKGPRAERVVGPLEPSQHALVDRP